MFGTGSIRAEIYSKARSEPLRQILPCNIVPERPLDIEGPFGAKVLTTYSVGPESR